MKLFNSLSRQVEEFVPITPDQAGIYTCGPTVYDYIHIGNIRSFILADILIRTLVAGGYQVKSVRNITDVEDKIIKRAKERDITPQQLTDEYTQRFLDDLSVFNIEPVDVSPKATDHVNSMIKYIEELIKKEIAYVESDGSVYFDISKFPEYGKLSQLDKRQLKTGTRVLSDEYTKDNIQDFALWKATDEDTLSWDSPWGKGRPGWHIECSVMSQEYLGDTFDIHTGGIDLLFPHHENEIAQAEAKTNHKFVNYFVHGEHLLIEGQKMSKSLNNIYKVSDLVDRGFDPMAFRYLVLTAHYRDKLNFTWDSLQAAQNALQNIRAIVRDWEKPTGLAGEYYQKFLTVINNDLNTPQGIAIVHELISSDLATAQKAADLLAIDQVLGLGLDKYIAVPLEIPAEVQSLLEKRQHAREHQDFAASDRLREEIKALGFEVKDTPEGQKATG